MWTGQAECVSFRCKVWTDGLDHLQSKSHVCISSMSKLRSEMDSTSPIPAVPVAKSRSIMASEVWCNGQEVEGGPGYTRILEGFPLRNPHSTPGATSPCICTLTLTIDIVGVSWPWLARGKKNRTERYAHNNTLTFHVLPAKSRTGNLGRDRRIEAGTALFDQFEALFVVLGKPGSCFEGPPDFLSVLPNEQLSATTDKSSQVLTY